MTPKTLIDTCIKPALSLLPVTLASPDAVRMLVAIAIQESNLLHRKQVVGPARGWWQFEVNGVRGVMKHNATSNYVRMILAELGYAGMSATEVHQVVEHNDTIAGVLARLNLWWLPSALPTEIEEGWNQYIEAWRPGKPHRHRWDRAWEAATKAVDSFYTNGVK